MVSYSKLLFFLTQLCSIGLALPLELSTDKASCKAVIHRANFDKMTNGSSPVDGFAGALWNGFTVVSPDCDTQFRPKSGLHVVEAADPETSTITAATFYSMELTSFYFACTAQFAHTNDQYSATCSIMVTSINNEGAQGIESVGPFTFTVPEYGPARVNMTKVDLGVESTTFYFQVVDAPAGAILYLDNVVITEFQC